ncbi:small GTPase superfamily [Syncephalis plumigaleata]|nr:small GTPase superfamily [Syncephalis plumigaleata]
MTGTEISASFKVVLIGNSSVGKSSFLARFIAGVDVSLKQMATTISAEFKSKSIEYKGKRYALKIWDTAGMERFDALTRTYYRGAHGAIIMYDVTNRKSFCEIEKWINNLESSVNNRHVVKMIIGNKEDRETDREVSEEEGQALADKFDALFAECSAATGDNVESSMESMIDEVSSSECSERGRIILLSSFNCSFTIAE